jgi:hypothetical protein
MPSITRLTLHWLLEPNSKTLPNEKTIPFLASELDWDWPPAELLRDELVQLIKLK